MKIVIFARKKYQKWIESENFEYAETIQQAAKNADFLTPHLGLGVFDKKTQIFSNQNLINEHIISLMNANSVIINYDRGELISCTALDKYLAVGKLRYIAVDADMFLRDNKITGPMAPYISLAEKYSHKLELLPHIAADTDHISRVAGAKQAIEQIYSAILKKEIINLKGALPANYINKGAQTINGVGSVTKENLFSVAKNKKILQELRYLSEKLANNWSALEVTDDLNAKKRFIK